MSSTDRTNHPETLRQRSRKPKQAGKKPDQRQRPKPQQQPDRRQDEKELIEATVAPAETFPIEADAATGKSSIGEPSLDEPSIDTPSIVASSIGTAVASTETASKGALVPDRRLPDRRSRACRHLPDRISNHRERLSATTPGDRSNRRMFFVEKFTGVRSLDKAVEVQTEFAKAGLRDLRCRLAADLAALQRTCQAGLAAPRAPDDAGDPDRALDLGRARREYDRRQVRRDDSGRTGQSLIDLIRLVARNSLLPFATRLQSRDQSPDVQPRQEIRPYLHRRRRLDLRAVARRVLSGEADAGEGAVICRLEADLDRDQRHLLRLAEAGELSQMGARGARRLCVLGEGTALRHQPPGAGGGRRFREAILRFRRARTRRPARSGALAIRADQEIRRSRFRQVSRTVAAQARRPRAAPCGRGAARQFLRRPISSRCCANSKRPVVFAEHGKYPAIADVVGDFVYARLQKGNDEIKTCYPPKQLDAWAKRFQAWADGGEPDDLPRVDNDQAEESAARRVRLCHPRGQGARARRRDGIDRAGEVIRWSDGQGQKALHHRL